MKSRLCVKWSGTQIHRLHSIYAWAVFTQVWQHLPWSFLSVWSNSVYTCITAEAWCVKNNSVTCCKYMLYPQQQKKKIRAIRLGWACCSLFNLHSCEWGNGDLLMCGLLWNNIISWHEQPAKALYHAVLALLVLFRSIESKTNLLMPLSWPTG